MTETRKRIKELKDALPRARERIVAVAVLLAMSVTMMATVSYAWYTMSFAPEVKGVATQVVSNGNLEVALAGRYDKDGNLLEPGNSAAGDSFASSGQSTTAANITWGNLINLRENYGIEDLVLRPATFLEGSPGFLVSMIYDEDGRVVSSTDNFDFTTWQKTTDGHKFMIPQTPQFGVRAISSMTVEETEIGGKLEDADRYHRSAWIAYKDKIVGNEEYITAIEGLVQLYLNANVQKFLSQSGELEDINCTDYIDELCKMMNVFYDQVVVNYAKALMGLANTQLYILDPLNYQPYELEEFVGSSEDELNARGVHFVKYGGNHSSWTEFQNLYSVVLEDISQLEGEYQKYQDSKESVMWSEIEAAIDHLIDINSVLIVDKNGKANTISEVMSKGTGVIDWATSDLDSSGVPIVVQNGQLKRFELLAGGHNMKVPIDFYVKVIIRLNYTGVLQTDLYGTSYTPLYDQNRAYTEAMVDDEDLQTNAPKTAGNTYGMVLDLWVRTNAANSVLTLDGMAQVETYYALKTIILSGETESTQAFLYTYYNGETMETEEGSVAGTDTIQIFQIPEDLNQDDTISEYSYNMVLNREQVTVTIYEGYFYDVANYNRVYLRDDKGEEAVDDEGNKEALTHEHFLDDSTDIKPETYSYEVVTGFTSSNRIDDSYTEDLEPGLISATQGSGSCYIFYASPEEAASTLQLLKSLKFEFCDSNGHSLASAGLDVEHVFSENGKYIVPLVITDTDTTYTDKSGKTFDGICALKQNEAKLISVVVYLDGAEVDNTMVMEKGNIQGSMNIQFSSSAKLSAMEDTSLSEETFTLDAKMNMDAMEFDPTDLSKTTRTLTATVDGISPTLVQAVFRRQINASQGSAMDPVNLTKDASGHWVNDVVFESPGLYVLKSLMIDGVEYELPKSAWITVEVKGFNVTSVDFCPNEGEEMALTAENYVDRPISLTFQKNNQVDSVSVRFLSDAGEYVAATLSPSPTSKDTWTGTVRFRTSGHYTLTFAVVNDEYYDLTDTFHEEFTAYLGLRARVYLQSPVGLNFPYRGEQEIKVLAEIVMDDGTTLKNQKNVKLFYHKRGSDEDPNGLSPVLTWKDGYYEGTFNVDKVGVYNFDRLTVGNNVIRAAISAPAVSAYSTNPPGYQSGIVKFEGQNFQTEQILMVTDTTKNIEFMVELTEAAGANSFTAVFKDPNGVERKITVGDQHGEAETDGRVEEIDGVIQVYFLLPKLENNAVAGGTWTMEALHIMGVYDSTGNFYGTQEDGTENPYILDSVKVGSQLPFRITVMNNMAGKVTPGSVTLGKDSNGDITASFMQMQQFANASGKLTFSFTSPGIRLDQYALSGTPNGGLAVSKVTLKLYYIKGSSQSHGSYSFDDVATAAQAQLFELEKKINAQGEVTWVLKDGAEISLAGAYKYKVDVTVDVDTDVVNGTSTFTEKTFTIDGGEVQLVHVYSAKPTVKVTGVSPNSSGHSSVRIYNTSTPNSTDSLMSAMAFTDVNKFTQFSAAVYCYVLPKEGGLFYQEAAIAYRPKVTLQMTGIPTSGVTNAVMTFEHPSGNSYDAVFNFAYSSNVYSATGEVGGFEQGQRGTVDVDKYPVFYPMNKKSVNQVMITYGGATYAVTLSDAVTINNPLCPPYADFTIGNDSYTGATPPRVFATPQADGTLKITLPSAGDITTSWNENKSESTTDTFVTISGPKETVYYETWGGCDGNQHQKYTKVVTVTQANESVSTWTRTWTITGWKVGNKTYGLGDTVSVSGGQTIEAVMSYVDGRKDANEYILTRTTTYYVTGPNTAGTPPPGYTNVTSDPDNANKDNWTSSNPGIKDDRVPKS